MLEGRGNGGTAGDSGDKWELGFETGTGRFCRCFVAFHVFGCTVLQLHCLLLLGDNHGIGDSMEPDSGSGGCILAFHQASSASTRHTLDSCRRRLGPLLSITSCIMFHREREQPPAHVSRILCTQIVHKIPAIRSHGLRVVVYVAFIVALQSLAPSFCVAVQFNFCPGVAYVV